MEDNGNNPVFKSKSEAPSEREGFLGKMSRFPSGGNSDGASLTPLFMGRNNNINCYSANAAFDTDALGKIK